jgi:LysM repeat protein
MQIPAETRLAAISWSLYAHTSEDELSQRLGRKSRETELASWLAQQPQNGHSARLAIVTRVASPQAQPIADPAAGRRRWQRRWAVGLAVAACGLVATVAVEAWPRNSSKVIVAQPPVEVEPIIAAVVAEPEELAELNDTPQLENIMRERSELARAVERMQEELIDRDTQLAKLAHERAQWLEDIQKEAEIAQAEVKSPELEARLAERDQQLTALKEQLSQVVALLEAKDQLLQQAQDKAAAATHLEEGYQRELHLREQLAVQLTQLKDEIHRQRRQLEEIDVTASAAEKAAARTHRVAPGETLTAIAQKYYGTSKRWREIYEANRAELPSQNTLRPGVTLVIP